MRHWTKPAFASLLAKMATGVLAFAPLVADACPRIVHPGPNNRVIAARLIDWRNAVGSFNEAGSIKLLRLQQAVKPTSAD